MKSKKDAVLLLRALKEDGIDEIYLPPVIKKMPAAAAPVKTKTASAEMSPVRQEMIKLREVALKCTLCDELASTRTKVVFGAGNIKAELMFIGEAPGQDEDEQGLPFVGRAGQLLTKIIESIGLSRDSVFIANVLKCRPPGNRPPKPDEIKNCRPYLEKQIELLKPKIICALGTFAAQTLLKSEEPIGKLRGRFIDFVPGTKVLCTYHPAYLLRNPGEKRTVWEDMKKIKAALDAGT